MIFRYQLNVYVNGDLFYFHHFKSLKEAKKSAECFFDRSSRHYTYYPSLVVSSILITIIRDSKLPFLRRIVFFRHFDFKDGIL